jgi:ribose/xylose/arabinose/galactoside ABC-type transport system permease subunit
MISGTLFVLVAVALGALCYSLERLSWLNRFFLAATVGMICGRAYAYLVGIENYPVVVQSVAAMAAGLGCVLWLAYRYPYQSKRLG